MPPAKNLTQMVKDRETSGKMYKVGAAAKAMSSDTERSRADKEKLAQEVVGSMKDGGMVKKTGLYKLHKGEKVIPADKVKEMDMKNKTRKKK